MLDFFFEHLTEIFPAVFVLAFLLIVLTKGEFGFFGWTISRRRRPLFYWSVLTLIVLVLILGIGVMLSAEADPN